MKICYRFVMKFEICLNDENLGENSLCRFFWPSENWNWKDLYQGPYEVTICSGPGCSKQLIKLTKGKAKNDGLVLLPSS